VIAKRIIHGVIFITCLLQLTLVLGPARQAWADRHDMAMFHDALAPYGSWINYGKYGPVWHPHKVASSWRPYLNGRWVPSHAGWVFETSEPWGWATYHYGNWMPTTNYGWVWSPGSTWYPSTVAWRTSDDYIGWAPIPPPDYAPEPAFYPEGGYDPAAPLLDSLASPLWIFIQAAQFLLGFGQPYAPAYSYYDSTGLLAPLSYAPIVYGGTFPLTDFYYPGYAPAAYYSLRPPFPYVSRVTNINIERINNYVNNYPYPRMRNVLPPPGLVKRYPYLREGIPPAVLEGRRFPITRVRDASRVERDLNRPGVLPPPAKLPVKVGSIPNVTPSHRMVSPKNLSQIKGMAMPYQATQHLTPTMRRQISLERQMQKQPRIETRPEFRSVAKPEAAPAVHEKVPPAPAGGMQPPHIPSHVKEVTPSHAIPPGHFQPGPAREFHAPAAKEFHPAAPREYHQPAARAHHPAPAREYHQPPAREYRPAIPREFRAIPAPVYRPRPQPTFHPPAPAPHAPPPPRAVSPTPHAPAPARAAPSHPHGHEER
jgi:hypothetical protein